MYKSVSQYVSVVRHKSLYLIVIQGLIRNPVVWPFWIPAFEGITVFDAKYQ